MKFARFCWEGAFGRLFWRVRRGEGRLDGAHGRGFGLGRGGVGLRRPFYRLVLALLKVWLVLKALRIGMIGFLRLVAFSFLLI